MFAARSHGWKDVFPHDGDPEVILSRDVFLEDHRRVARIVNQFHLLGLDQTRLAPKLLRGRERLVDGIAYAKPVNEAAGRVGVAGDKDLRGRQATSCATRNW